MTQRSTSRPLPGQQPLPRAFVVRHQRERIIAALIEEAADQGYPAVTISDIVRRAGIARNTFYENFGSKEECFLAAQEYAMSAALERILGAAAGVEEWTGKISAGLAALLDFVATEPALARAGMVEALAAGPTAAKCYEESQEPLISLLRLGRDVSLQGGDLPETLEEAIVGGVFWIVNQRLTIPEAGTEGLLPELLEFALTPYLGLEEAREIAAANGSMMPAGDPGGER